MTPQAFTEKLGAILREVALATHADLAEHVSAYWNGERVVYYVRDGDRVEHEFELDELIWDEWESRFDRWMQAPTFSVRPEMKRLHRGASPRG